MSKFTYYGHACFMLEIQGQKLLFDPFLDANPEKASLITTIEADYILVSHGHADHTAQLVDIAKRTGAVVLAAYEITEWCKTKGITNVLPFNFGGERDLPFGQVKFVYAQHSSVLPDGSYAANPGGFLIISEEKTIYYSGDTSLCMDMKLIPERAVPDVAILPIGDVFTMGLDDAFTASDFVQCDDLIGVHFDTFDDIKIDHLQAQEKAALKSKRLTLPKINTTIDI